MNGLLQRVEELLKADLKEGTGVCQGGRIGRRDFVARSVLVRRKKNWHYSTVVTESASA